MILIILRVIIGLFILFLPGTLLIILIGRDLTGLEKVCMGFGLTILIIVCLAFLLTGIGWVLNIKAITVPTVYASLIILSAIFGAAIYKIKF